MTLDIAIGFRKKPNKLESFLKEQGYSAESKTRNCVIFVDENEWPQLFYYPKAIKPKKREMPNWKQAGFKVVSELNINFPYNKPDCYDEVERISEAIIRQFDGIIYDPELEAYFTKEDI